MEFARRRGINYHRGINHGSYIQLPKDKNRSKDPFCGIFAPIPIYTSCSFVPLKTVFNSSARLHFCCKSNKKLKNATKNNRMCNFSFAIHLLFVNLQPHKRKGNLQIPLQSVSKDNFTGKKDILNNEDRKRTHQLGHSCGERALW